MYLFLCSLSMLFLANMFGYFLAFVNIWPATRRILQFISPGLVWISTVVLLAGSFYAIHRAVGEIRLERQAGLCGAIWRSRWRLAIIFVAVQTPRDDFAFPPAHRVLGSGAKSLYGLVGVLILVHALHVIGGIIAMVTVTVRANRGKYDHEAYMGVRNAALYWHFLDIVWLVMFTMFLVTA